VDVASTKDWWQGAVVYEIYPLSFKDSNGDGVGDLKGVINKLDYVASLGVDALWICPFFKSPMRDFGYDVSDYYSVDPLFGSLDEAKQLIKNAHAMGLKVIFDMVPCHTSDQHPWFIESRAARSGSKSEWYIWSDAKRDGTPPNNWLSIFGGSAWAWEPRRSQYYFHSFLSSQPALNVSNREVLSAILDVMRFWYDLGVDGFRLDAITAMAPDSQLRDNPPVPEDQPLPYVDGGGGNPFLKQIHLYDRDSDHVLPILRKFRELADQYDPPKFIFAEIGDVDGCIVGAKYAAAHLVHAAFIQDLILSDLTSERAATVLRRMSQIVADAWTFNAFSSQDIARQVSRWKSFAGEGADRTQIAKLLMGILLTLRGCACISQGEELGLPDVDLPFEAIRDPWGLRFYPDFKGRDSCRTPLPWQADAVNAGFSAGRPWLPVGAEHYALAVDVQNSEPTSVLNAYRTFINWRKKHPALMRGRQTVFDAPCPILAFTRASNDVRMLLAFNLSGKPIEWRPIGEWRQLAGHGLPSAAEANGVIAFRGLDAYIAIERRTG
jgi:alpha-glucosidase